MHPWGTADTPLEMPAVLVRYSPGGIAVEQLVPVVTANGAAIPASAPGRYGQVVMTGNARR